MYMENERELYVQVGKIIAEADRYNQQEVSKISSSIEGMLPVYEDRTEKSMICDQIRASCVTSGTMMPEFRDRFIEEAKERFSKISEPKGN